MRNSILVLAIILALFLVACGQQQSLGAGNIPNSAPFILNEGTLDGSIGFNFTNQTSGVLNIGSYSEKTLWVNCSGAAVNITLLKIQYSSDNSLWANSTTGVAGCYQNFTKYDLTDKGMNYARLIIGTNNTGVGANVTARIVLGLA